MDLQREIVQRKERWSRYVVNDNPPRFVFEVGCAEAKKPDLKQPEMYREDRDARVEWAWQNYQAQLDMVEWIPDDRVPYLNMVTGTEVFAEAFGCSVSKPEGSPPFALHVIEDASEVSKISVPNLMESSVAYLFEMADELVGRAGPDAALKMIDVQSPMDVAALIWDKGRLFPAMLDSPSAVKELAEKALDLLIAFHDEWFARYSTGHIAHYPDYYVPHGITLSEDEIGAVGPGMFVEFFLPGLTVLAKRYGGMGIHCCADARHQWENFKKIPQLFLLNVPKGDDQYEVFEDSVVHYHHQHPPLTADMSLQQIDDLLSEKVICNGRRTVLKYHCKTRKESVALAEKLRQLQPSREHAVTK